MARPRQDSIDVPNLYRKKDKRNGKVYYQYKNQVTGKFVSLGTDKVKAIESAVKANRVIEERGLMQILQEQKRQDEKIEREHGVLITEFCDKLLKHFEVYEFDKLSDSTIREKKRHLEIFRNRFSTIRIKRISVLDISALLDEYIEDGKLSAAKTLRSYLSVFFKEAQYMGFVDSGFNPALSTRPVEAKVKRARITESDFSVFWKNCQNGKSKHFIDSVKIAVTTGLRRSDIVNLKFSDVRDGYLHVSLGKSRGKTNLAFPLEMKSPLIGEALGEIISGCRRKVVSRFVVHHQNSAPRVKIGGQVNPSSLSQSFRAIWDKSGIETPTDKTAPTFHELRSLCVRSYGADTGNLQKLLGHAEQHTTEVYLDERDKAKINYIDVPEVA
ncbi:phage integrase Arm DNA-binding domain-containing protein [Vibrio parahaemolyticus]|nr:phage integrase Arm DNA-binding domain-containing protein [Vibrio parahaemolyticus]EIU6754938.1 phage integrase Arm DNA-binding domain-containing protein [Vibrio parahaemolyticus]